MDSTNAQDNTFSTLGDKVVNDGCQFYCENDAKSFALEKSIKQANHTLRILNRDRRDNMIKKTKKRVMRNANLARFLSSLDDDHRPFTQQCNVGTHCSFSKTKKQKKNSRFVPQSDFGKKKTKKNFLGQGLFVDEEKIVESLSSALQQGMDVGTDRLAEIVHSALSNLPQVEHNHTISLSELTPEFVSAISKAISDGLNDCKPKVDLNMNLPTSNQWRDSGACMGGIVEGLIQMIGGDVRFTAQYIFTLLIKYWFIVTGIMLLYELIRYGASKLDVIWNYIRSFFVKEEFVPQSGIEDWWTQFAVVITQMWGQGLSAKSVTNLVNSFKKKTEGVKDFVQFLKGTLEVIVNTFRHYILGLDPIKFDNTDDKKIRHWLSAIRDFQLREANGTLSVDSATFEALKSLRVIGCELAARFDDVRNPELDKIRVVIKTGKAELEKLFDIFRKNNYGKVHLRPKPLTIALLGKSGVGKSAVTVPLVNSVLIKTMKSKEELELFRNAPSCFIYSRASETGYWDGYHGQKVVVYDDFLQANDNKAHGSIVQEAFEVIRGSNVFPYLLHKAHLEDKGNSYLEARMLLCTSNCMNLKTDMIKEEEALWRRFEAIVLVCPKLEYCREGTTTGSLTDRRLADLDEFTVDVYEFHLQKHDGAEWKTFLSLDYDSFVRFLVDKYNNLECKDESYKAAIDDIRESEINEANTNFVPQSCFEDAKNLVGKERTTCEKIKQYFDDIFSYLGEATKKLMGWFKNTVKKYPLYSLLAGTLSACGLIYLFSSKYHEPQNHAYHEPRVQHKTARNRNKGKLLSFLYPEAESSPYTELQRSIIRKNSYVIRTPWSERAGLALGISGQYMILNAHFYLAMKRKEQDFDIEFLPLVAWCNDSEYGSVKVRFSYLAKNAPTPEMVNKDVWLVEIPNLRPHRDITGHFIDEKFLSSVSNIPFLMVRLEVNEKQLTTYSGSSPLTELNCVDIPTMKVIKYQVRTEAGDCGSVIFVNDKYSDGNILGIHYCGDGIQGAATIVTRQFLKSIIGAFKPQCADSDTGCEFHHRSLTLNLGDNIIEPPPCVNVEEEEYTTESFGLERIGTISPGVFVTRKSKLRQSQFYSVFNAYLSEWKAPAVLVGSPDPFDVAITKYSTPDYHIGGYFCRLASDSYLDTIKRYSRGDSRVILSFETACMGTHGDDTWNSIPRKTSPGFPWVDICKKPGKKDFFGEEGDYDFSSDMCTKLRKRVSFIIDKAKSGTRLLHLYADAMKDELRSFDKIVNKKTRLIAGAPLDYVVACRIYFGSFVSSFIKRRIYNGSAVGINPYGREWTEMVQHLLATGRRTIAGDFSGFDTTQTKEILWSIFEIIDSWYHDGNTEIRRTLWMDVVNSVHLHSDELLIMTHCLPSGHPLTSIINTIYVNILFRMCWMKVHNSARSLDYFEDFITLVAYGDDNISTVEESEMGDKFNYQTLTEAMSFFGMTYTDEDKNDVAEIGPYKDISDCSFLKRGFVFNKEMNRWIAPLDINTVLQLPYFYRDGFDPIGRQEGNVIDFYRELCLHGKDIYNDLTREIIEYSEKYTSIDLMRPPPHEVIFCESIGRTWRPITDMDYESEGSEGPCQAVFPDEIGAIQPYSQGDFKPQGSFDTTEMGNNRGVKKIPASNKNMSGNEATQSQAEGQFGQGEQITGTTQIGNQEHLINTTFSDDAETRTMQPFPIGDIKVGRHLHVGDNYQKDSVIDFMRTPVMVKNFNVASTATANTTLDTTVLPFDSTMIGFGTDLGVGMFLKRLNAYLGFRATAVLRFQVNCNRFAQGRLLIHYIPGQLDSAEDAKSHRFNLTTKSQNPRTELNLNRDTACIFRVPYVSANVAYDLSGTTVNSRIGKMGNLYTTVYSPLVGATSLNVSIFLSFEDVELITPSFTPQMNTSDREQRRGLLSGPLTITSEALAKMSQIPTLSSMMGSASWFIKACAKSAEAFGYSKPNNELQLQRVTMTKNAYQLNYDGDEDNYKMGLSAANKLDILPGFAGNDIDEMSIEYLCNRPAYITALNWNTASGVNTIIYNLDLSPVNFEIGTTVDGRVVTTMPPFSLLARYFGYWRADIIVTFKIVKTEFHTGKLVALYRPGLNGAPTPDAGNFLARQVVDIKESDTFSFECRYAALTPFEPHGTSMGNFSVYVLNALNAPSSVSANVSILVEISAKNVMFSLPSATTIMPATGNTPVFTPQMDEGTREKYFIMGDFESHGIDPNISRFCVGEHITSIKQLLHRKCLIRSHKVSATSIRNVIIKPFTIAGTWYDGSNWVDHPMAQDYYSLFSCCFVLQRGAIRYSFYNNNGDNHAASYAFEALGPLLPWQTNSVQSAYYTGTIFQTKGSMSGYLDIEIPHSSFTHSRECQTEFELTATVPPLGCPSSLIYYSCNATFGNFADLRIQRSVGDDFQLGFFVGVPSVVITQGVRDLS